MAKSDFFASHEFTARWEGGLSDHPADKGGLTAYGASINFVQGIAATQGGRNFLQQIGVVLPVTRQSMRLVTADQARAMFRMEFWDALGLDCLPQRPATMLYDAAVNCGRSQSVKFAQRGYNRCVLHSAKLDVDGKIGPLTRKALQQDTDAVVSAVIQARRDFYNDLVVAKPSQKVFLKGWLNRCDALEKMLLA
ncbi:glycoside hydrolase family 108 protein [Desulfovibrio sp. SGI.169]|uniref:glycoside hydrolase family 108 protein n=1 Tax=Desulfovibrio sp. SGI.169 TaxID=3420561 RepID=UPI003CFCC668